MTDYLFCATVDWISAARLEEDQCSHHKSQVQAAAGWVSFHIATCTISATAHELAGNTKTNHFSSQQSISIIIFY